MNRTTTHTFATFTTLVLLSPLAAASVRADGPDFQSKYIVSSQ
jgi:hypothetical protein